MIPMRSNKFPKYETMSLRFFSDTWFACKVMRISSISLSNGAQLIRVEEEETVAEDEEAEEEEEEKEEANELVLVGLDESGEENVEEEEGGGEADRRGEEIEYTAGDVRRCAEEEE